jgi:hypothetical protein
MLMVKLPQLFRWTVSHYFAWGYLNWHTEYIILAYGVYQFKYPPEVTEASSYSSWQLVESTACHHGWWQPSHPPHMVNITGYVIRYLQ